LRLGGELPSDGHHSNRESSKRFEGGVGQVERLLGFASGACVSNDRFDCVAVSRVLDQNLATAIRGDSAGVAIKAGV